MHMITSTQYRMHSTELKLLAAYNICREQIFIHWLWYFSNKMKYELMTESFELNSKHCLQLDSNVLIFLIH